MTQTLAGQLVAAFGRPAEMSQLYANEIVWSLSESLGRIAGPYVGRDAVVAFNERVWSSFYYPDVSVLIQDELGDATSSAVRFRYTARLRSSGNPYSVEYCVFARAESGLITSVFEAMDTLGSANLFAGNPITTNPYRSR